MPNSDLLPSLLSKLYENQLALEASILELSNWVEQRGSANVAERARRSAHHRRERRVHKAEPGRIDVARVI